MRRQLLVLAFAALVLSTASAVRADDGEQASAPPASTSARMQAARPNVPRYYYVRRRPQRKNFFERLWELEQRKNAWIRRNILNR